MLHEPRVRRCDGSAKMVSRNPNFSPALSSRPPLCSCVETLWQNVGRP